MVCLYCIYKRLEYYRLNSSDLSKYSLEYLVEKYTTKKVEIIPLEIVLRNIAAGSLCKETPIVTGEEGRNALEIATKIQNMIIQDIH